jgi:hypothetical protein
MAEDLDKAVDAARTAYIRERESLEKLLAEDFRQPGDAADVLLSLADEFGLDHTQELLAERPGDFAERRAGGGDWAERSQTLMRQADKVVAAQDRLDSATARRDAANPRHSGRSLNIQGEEFVVYGRDPLVVPAPGIAKGERSPTQQVMREKGVAPAAPQQTPSRGPSRGR